HALAHHRQGRGDHPGRRAPGQAVLPARALRKGRQDQGAPDRQAVGALMSEEDLERYEAEIELGLVQEYRAVLPVFSYVIETERRFSLANEVSLTVRAVTTPACVELELRDAWVWDMYRPARFVPSVRVITFRDVNIERLPEQEL